MTLIKKRQEEPAADVSFHVHKFSARPKPTGTEKIVIISCFSEFGCEVVGAMYCIPRIVSQHPDAYIIVMGWYGRDYLYRHLADEYWETKEEFQWLRDYAAAFHHKSRNLAKVERAVARCGKVITAEALGRIAVGNSCQVCSHFWGQSDHVQRCPKCDSAQVVKSLFSDIKTYRPQAVPVPVPRPEKLAEARALLGPRPVGVVGRNRATYGRNLPPEFYVQLLEMLRGRGHTPIWLGEPQSTMPCPVEGVVDFRSSPASRDLELTLAIVKQVEFTVQFWTASTRLAAVMGTPYLLFESPDQLYGNGQEGYRLALSTLGHKKVALCHYLNVYNDHPAALEVVARCLDEMAAGNWDDVIGLVEDRMVVETMRRQNLHRTRLYD